METAPSVEARAEASGAGFEAAPSVEFTACVGLLLVMILKLLVWKMQLMLLLKSKVLLSRPLRS